MRLVSLIAVLAIAAAACGGSPIDFEAAWTDATYEAAREQARELLGVHEDDLPDDARIGRRGEESFAVTMDLRPGRRTVELDDTGDGFHVVTVTLETPEGTEVFE